jgi:peptidoglycan L-alanyl-D-glutamate endopeptidase CwlK
MINSRKLEDLLPYVAKLAKDLIAECHKQGIDLLITSTYRDKDSQNALYAQGRTAPGKIVTNARAGQSFHNWKVAFDVVPLRNGKPVWSTSGNDMHIWETVGAIGKKLGLEWAGDWKSFPEFPHFQATGGLKLADFQAGKQPKYA